MGKFHKSFNYLLGLLCASAVTFQALAAESTVRVHTSVDSSGYRGMTGRTFRTPPGVNVQPNPSFTRSVQKYGNGLQQTMGGNVSIDGVKGTHPISANVRATDSTLKRGAKSLFKGGLVGIALTAGLEAVLDGLGWIMDEGSQPGSLQIKKMSVGTSPDALYSVGACGWPGIGSNPCPANDMTVPVMPYLNGYYYCPSFYHGERLTGVSGNGSCQFGGTSAIGYNPVSENDIDAAIDNHYQPQPEDWPLLSPRIQPDDVEIYQLPGVILGEPETVTVTDAAGNPVSSTVTQPAFDLVPRNNPSAQPELDLNRNVETRTYNEHGELTGISTASSTAPAGGGGGEPPEPPTDCAFMPTVCAFLAWFQDPDPELNNEPDYSAIRDDIEPGDPDFQVGASTAGCPPPIQISFSMFPSTEVSLQPLCDFVDLLRPLVLMLAFFASASIVLRS